MTTSLSQTNTTRQGLPDINKKTYNIKLTIDKNSHSSVFSYLMKLQEESKTFLSNPLVMNSAIHVVRNSNGRLRASALRKELKGKILGHGKNIHESTYTLALGAAKGYLFNLELVQAMIDMMSTETLSEFIYFGRSPKLERKLAYKFKVQKEYARNFILGARRKLAKHPFKLMHSPIIQVLDAIDELLLDNTIKASFRVFLQSIDPGIISEVLNDFFSKTYTNPWSALRDKSNTLFSGKFYWIFRIVSKILSINFSYNLPDKTAFISMPFQNSSLPPIMLIMKKSYVVIREGNASELTDLARKRGYLELEFPISRKEKVKGRLIIHNKIQEYLRNGTKIVMIQLNTAVEAINKIHAKIIFEGPDTAFISYKQVQSYVRSLNPMSKSSDVVGIDINRLGKHVLEFSEDVILPKSLTQTLTKVSADIQHQSKLLEKSDNLQDIKWKSNKQAKIKGEIDRLFGRKVRLRKSLHQALPLFIAAVLVAYKVKKLAIEDLNLPGRNTKGALAKAYYSMPDQFELYQKSVIIASQILGYKVCIVKVNPKNTSRMHYSCSGKLLRSKTDWDFATCVDCGARVNTHKNAALNIMSRAI